MTGNIDIQKRPEVIGHWTNNLIYRQLPKGVLEGLKKKTHKSQKGNYSARFHQSLTLEMGEPHLETQLVFVITIMRNSDNWEDFMFNFNKAYGQQSLFDMRTFEPKQLEKPKLSEFDKNLITAIKHDYKGKKEK